MEGARRRAALQTAAVTLGLAPLAWLGVRALRGDLGANPIEAVTHATGLAALRLLLVALAITPSRRWLGLRWLAPLRRTFGLLAFGYACLHLLTYVVLDQFFDWQAILEDVAKRPYITAGFFAFLCLSPLAATSTRAMVRRLGRRWKPLHRLAYVAAIAAVVHFLWLVKKDTREPLTYAAVLALLLAGRWPQKKSKTALAARGETAS
ncbi:MAG TPA: protein-methionine-sulfoxide reductase heme-binding subunit MsrQ [Myxococcota bacterium]|nr:protein-methionine-sulfoxide reductase heme-binding subunit MsrQ [Myxococcota bacterium]